MSHLQLATGFTYTEVLIDKAVEFDNSTKDWLANTMIEGSRYLNKNSAAGSDGVHPFFLKDIDISEADEKEKLHKLFKSSLDKRNLFESRVSLIPKPKTYKMRPIRVLNVHLRCAEKGLLAKLKMVKLTKEDKMLGFISNKDTHQAYDFIQQSLRDGQVPTNFLDFSSAYDRAS